MTQRTHSVDIAIGSLYLKKKPLSRFLFLFENFISYYTWKNVMTMSSPLTGGVPDSKKKNTIHTRENKPIVLLILPPDINFYVFRALAEAAARSVFINSL